MKKENQHFLETETTARERIEQARALKEQARKGGLRFEAYLPSSLAVWVLEMVEQGVFVDPSEAVFVLMGQASDLDPHDDLKDEILKRSLQKAVDNPRPPITSLKEKMERWRHERVEPVVWEKSIAAIPVISDRG